ncbi:MAG: NADH-quinone oxidoreductase subunit NuoK [Methylacidiphilales bacterium]|nr:NADH-quinone oxidoreductase subunit NuoK [Candidatus Methylacidiphilales bacterium]
MIFSEPILLYLSVTSACIFLIASIGLYVHKKNLIMVLLCLELILISVNLQILTIAKMYNDLSGQIAVFFILTVAAAETAIGLALVILIYRNRSTVSMEELNQIKEI